MVMDICQILYHVSCNFFKNPDVVIIVNYIKKQGFHLKYFYESLVGVNSILWFLFNK
jgi:hypothetical protein